MAQRHVHHAKIVTAFVRRAGALEDGKVRCAACSAVVGLTPNGRLREHRTPAGEDCAHRAFYGPPVHLDELPPVVLPPQAQPPKRVPIRERAAGPEPVDVEADARLAPRNGACVDCGRRVPGERVLCSKCSRRRNVEKGRSA